MTRRVLPFIPQHAIDLAIQDSQKLDWHDSRRMARFYADTARAYTILSAENVPIFCGGAVELMPVIDGEGGHAQLWALFGKNKRYGMLRVLRATRNFIAGLPHLRVDTPVSDRPEARQWAEMLGLVFDVRLQAAGPRGADVLIYRRAY